MANVLDERSPGDTRSPRDSERGEAAGVERFDDFYQQRPSEIKPGSLTPQAVVTTKMSLHEADDVVEIFAA